MKFFIKRIKSTCICSEHLGYYYWGVFYKTSTNDIFFCRKSALYKIARQILKSLKNVQTNIPAINTNDSLFKEDWKIL